MSLELPFGVKVLNPTSLDHYYSVGGTPYASIAAVNAAIPAAVRYRGLTVNINGDEYWYKNGTLDGNLVMKTPTTDAHYIHTQGMAAQVWSIAHHLNKRPSIHFEDMSGNVMYPEIIHIDNNNAQAIFGNSGYSGTAYCN